LKKYILKFTLYNEILLILTLLIFRPFEGGEDFRMETANNKGGI